MQQPTKLIPAAVAPAGDRPQPAKRPPAWLFYATLLPVLGAIVGYGGVYSYIWAPVDLALFAATIIWLWLCAIRGRGLPRHALMLPMAAFGLLIASQWFFRLSIYPGATLTGLVQLGACGCVFLLSLSLAGNDFWVRRFAWILWLFCGLLSAEAIVQYFEANKYIYWFHNATYALPVGPFVYHNFYSGCLDLLLPIALVVAFRAERSAVPTWITWLRRGIVPAAGFASVIISQSVGGLLTLGFELLLALILYRDEIRKHRRARTLLLTGCVLLLGFSVLANWSPVWHRFTNLGNSHDPSLYQRLRVAQSCWHIFLDHPLLGTGFNTFATVYPAYQTFDNGLLFLYAHNEYAQMLAETGLAGLVCILGFLLLWGHALRRRLQRKSGDTLIRHIQLAAFIATAGFMFHSFGDFLFHAPSNALLFFLLIGIAIHPVHKISGKSPKV